MSAEKWICVHQNWLTLRIKSTSDMHRAIKILNKQSRQYTNNSASSLTVKYHVYGKGVKLNLDICYIATYWTLKKLIRRLKMNPKSQISFSVLCNRLFIFMASIYREYVCCILEQYVNVYIFKQNTPRNSDSWVTCGYLFWVLVDINCRELPRA